jgi:hypothetical protein
LVGQFLHSRQADQPSFEVAMPVRKISNATPFKTLCRIADDKGIHHDAESLLEADNLIRHLLDPNVVSFEAQPMTLRYPYEGRMRRYTPDVLVVYRDRTVPEIQEVKPSVKVLTDDFRTWERIIRTLVEQTGATFRVVTEVDLRREPRHTNLQILHRYWKWPIDQRQRREVLSWFHEAQIALGELRRRAALASIPVGVIFHLLARSELTIDLDQPFDNAAVVGRICHG